MSDQPRVGGLDQRFAPRRAGRVRIMILLGAVVLGALAGLLLALETVPHPGCQPEDGICKLNRIYLAQIVKVVGGMAVFYLLAEALAIRLPNAIDDRRRRRAYEAELALRPPAAPPRPFDASVARQALDAVGRGAALPPAALRAIARANETPLPPPPPRLGTHAAQQARATLDAVSAAATLPPAALRALEAAPPAPAPAPAAPTPQEAAQAALDAVNRAPRLPPAALEALLREGPALGGGPRRDS